MKTKTTRRSGVWCRPCGWVGVSWSVHDFKSCGCSNQTFIDGGTSYIRIGAVNLKLTQLVIITIPVLDNSKGEIVCSYCAEGNKPESGIHTYWSDGGATAAVIPCSAKSEGG